MIFKSDIEISNQKKYVGISYHVGMIHPYDFQVKILYDHCQVKFIVRVLGDNAIQVPIHIKKPCIQHG